MSDRVYTLYQKTTSRATGETKTYDIFTSDDIIDVLNGLMDNLNTHISWGESVEMTGFGSFRSETFETIYVYYIDFKFKEGKGPSEPEGYDSDPEHRTPEYCKECCYNPGHPCRKKVVKLNINTGAWKEEESSTRCGTCKNYESSSDITGWCSACPGTVIKDMNTNNTCAAYEKRRKANES